MSYMLWEEWCEAGRVYEIKMRMVSGKRHIYSDNDFCDVTINLSKIS